MRDKVLRAIQTYAEGGTIADAIDAQKMRRLAFYQTKDAHRDLTELYDQVQRFRADMMYDEAYRISTDTSLSPSAAREMAAIRMKIGQAYDRKRFGDRIDVNATVATLDLTAARARSALPPRDLASVAIAQVIDIPYQLTSATTDKQSDEAADEPDDIFAD